MAAQKRKIVVLVAAAALGGIVLMRLAPVVGGEPNLKNSQSKTDFVFARDPNLSVGSADRPDSRELFAKMMLSVVLVVVLGVAAVYVSKRFLPKIANLPGKRIRVVETAYLGPRKAVHLVKVDSRHILIGSTGEHITKLADVAEDMADVPSEHKEGLTV